MALMTKTRSPLPELPAELRNYIYEYALPGEKRVENIQGPVG